MSQKSYFLEATGDLTDRTSEILSILKEFGTCHLGPGVFTVANLHMPKNSFLAGEGNSTVLRLPENIENGYVIRMDSFCAVKDLRLKGSEEPIEISNTVRNRHGILWMGNYSEDNTDYPERGTVENVTVSGFAGGGLTLHNTGYPIQGGLNVTNVYVLNCDAGIHIDYWSEFSRFTNIHTQRCSYGLINNGGNNNFLNCSFSGNTLGVLMDNTDNKSPNNAHGTMVACEVDHSDFNKGVGFRLINLKPGYVFSGIQLFFSDVEIEDCDGIQFANLNGGKNVNISVKGGGLVAFDHCIFGTAPIFTITDNPNVKITECYLRDGSVVEA